MSRVNTIWGNHLHIVKLQAKSLASELTLFNPCHNENNKNNNKNLRQNISEGGVLEVWNLTHKLHMSFWLRLWGYGSKGPMSKEEQEQQEPHQNLQEGSILKI